MDPTGGRAFVGNDVRERGNHGSNGCKCETVSQLAITKITRLDFGGKLTKINDFALFSAVLFPCSSDLLDCYGNRSGSSGAVIADILSGPTHSCSLDPASSAGKPF